MPAHQFAERADELVIGHAIHVDLLLLMLQALQAAQVRVGQRLNESVASKGLLVRVCCPQALFAVRHLAGHACLDCLLRRFLLTELAPHRLWGRPWAGHGGGTDRNQCQSVAAGFLAGRVGWSRRGRGPLDSFNDVLQGHVALEPLQSTLGTQRDDIAAGGTLEGGNAVHRLAGSTVGDEDTVGAAEAQAVGAGQQQGVVEELQADWAGQL